MENSKVSARLRKAFRYHNETDTTSEPDAMDEEEQEQLIQDLQRQNDESNSLWLKCLLALDALCFVVFILLSIQASSKPVKLVCFLALTSVVMTGYILLFIPTGTYKLAIFPSQDLSPAQRFVPYMNAVLSLLIGVSGTNWRNRPNTPNGFFMASWMPSVMFGIVIVARQILVEVDPQELWNFKYELKGA